MKKILFILCFIMTMQFIFCDWFYFKENGTEYFVNSDQIACVEYRNDGFSGKYIRIYSTSKIYIHDSENITRFINFIKKLEMHK